MEQSEEIKQVIRRMHASDSAGDVDAGMKFFSHQPGLIFIGTDPGNWWVGYDTINRRASENNQETGGGIRVEINELNAYTEGSIGWAVERDTVHMPNGRGVSVRATTILHREDGEWKIVHEHISIGVANSEAFSQEYTIALND